MWFSHAFQKTNKQTKENQKNPTKLQLPFALALSLANFFAFSKMSAMDGDVILFEENVYFMRIHNLGLTTGRSFLFTAVMHFPIAARAPSLHASCCDTDTCLYVDICTWIYLSVAV